MRGTEEKNEWIYREYKDKVWRYISGKIAVVQDAEDLHAEVFLKIYQKQEQFDEKKASLSTWIYAITRNTVIDYFRKQHLSSELPEVLMDPVNPFDKIYTEETLRELSSALGELPERERDVIILHYYKGETLGSIAMQMRMSYSNVKLVHKKALKKLQERLVEL